LYASVQNSEKMSVLQVTLFSMGLFGCRSEYTHRRSIVYLTSLYSEKHDKSITDTMASYFFRRRLFSGLLFQINKTMHCYWVGDVSLTAQLVALLVLA